MVGSGWTAEQNHELIMTLVLGRAPTQGEWVTISEKLGQGKTAEACRQHFKTLKNTFEGNNAAGTKRKADDDGEGVSAEAESGDASPPEKPAKAAAKPKAKAKAKEGGAKVKAARGGKEAGSGRGGKAAGTGRGGKKAKKEPVKEVPQEEEAVADEVVEKGTFVPEEEKAGNEVEEAGDEVEKVDEI